MSREEDNKAVILGLIRAFNEHDREAFQASYADEVVAFHAGSGKERLTREREWEITRAGWEIYPDLTATLLSMVADGDHVWLYWKYSATHLGKGKPGVEPTGKRAEWHAFSDYRLVDGKIVEAWQLHDGLSLYEQLGFLKRPW